MSSKTETESKTRSQTIVKSGYLFILINFLLAVFNIIVGLLSNSLAIASDAVHSLTDSISGFLIIISEKLAIHHKFSKYRATIERITTIIIALIIILVGIEIIILSIKNIISPEEVDYSLPTIVVLIASIATKYLLANYLKKTGKVIKSSVLIASAAETMNDTWISIAVLFSAIIYLIWQINIESYISIIIALVIVRIGLEFIFPHLSKHHHHHLESDPDHDHCGKK
ncbi:cation diffusion facilitator family transporter [Candidatus Saccharibacteria bacterium]|nr:cation diffusion facilitator family transporter [Candidatus Saccharibacteria bacterium]